MARRAYIAVLFLSALSLAVPLPSPVRILFAALQLFFIPGYAVLNLVGEGDRPAFDDLFLPLLLSPVIVVLLTLAANPFTDSPRSALTIAIALSYTMLAAALIAGKMDGRRGGSIIPRSVLLICFSYGGLILLSYVINPYLIVRSDAWYHASVVTEISSRGIPPREPWLAGLPIRYMWFYHLFISCWKDLAGLSVFQAMSFFNVVNAFAFPYVVARFIANFTSRPRNIAATSLFAVAGLESASWILWPVCLLTTVMGEVRGLTEIREMIAGISLDNSLDVMILLRPCWTWMVNLSDKFVTITAFSHSFTLFLLCIAMLTAKRMEQRPPLRTALTLILIVAGTFFFHVVNGIALILSIICTVFILVLFARFIQRTGFEWRMLIPAGAAVLVAAAGLPYLSSLRAAGSGSAGVATTQYLHIGLTNILTITAPLVVLFFPARSALKEIFSFRDYRCITVGSVLICLLALNVFIDLPAVNESKLIFPLFLVLGPLIYLKIIERIRESTGGRRFLIATATAVLFIVPPFMTFRAFLVQKPDTDSAFSKRFELTHREHAMLEWIRNETPEDAVFMENNIHHLIPIYARRRNFYSTDGVLRVLGYGGEELALYKKIHEEIFSEGELHEGSIESLRDMEPRIYIVAWRDDLEANPVLEEKLTSHPEWFSKVYDSDIADIYAVKE